MLEGEAVRVHVVQAGAARGQQAFGLLDHLRRSAKIDGVLGQIFVVFHDGLLHVADDRHLQLTDTGRHQATAVMRKHRLAERLLIDIIGLDWEDVHIEACRWEHVMSDAVERRIVALLQKPLVCPHGNPIPGLDELGLPFTATDDHAGLITISAAVLAKVTEAVVERISEQLQSDAAMMHRFAGAGLLPGRRVRLDPLDLERVGTEAG